MKRLLRVAMCLPFVVPPLLMLPACARPCSDHAFSISIPSGAKGAGTAKAAVEAWTRGKLEGYDHDPSAWRASTSEPSRFSDGTAHITVSHIPPPGSGYIVTDGTACAQ